MSLIGAFTASMITVPRALAQPAGRLVVVPHSTHELTEAEQRAADLVESGLSVRRARLVSMHEARDRMQTQSRPPASPDNSDLDVLAQEAHAALEHVAFGRSAAAQRSVQEVLSRAERALESLNRETKTARNVLDACLALVRNALARDERRDALAEAMRCRRLVPDVSPSEMLHPASVIGVLAEADDQLRRMRIGRLTVESKPDTGCAVYVNGRHLGVTPFRLERAAAGEYRVQVECGHTTGRVHFVTLGDEPVSVLVDADYDRALRSGSRVSLVYASEKDRSRQVEGHAALVAKAVRADEAVLVRVDADEVLLERVGVGDGRVLGRAHFAWLRVESADAPELGAALEALFQGRMQVVSAEPALAAAPLVAAVPPLAEPEPTLTAAQPVTSPTDEQRARKPMSRTRKLRITAGALASAGGALLVTGIAYEMQHARADSALSKLTPSDPADAAEIADQQDKYDHSAKLRWLGVGGAALLTAAVPLLRVDVREGVPWWSYALGASGVGLAAWGAVELAKNGDCELYGAKGCYEQRDSQGRGALLVSAAAPLLAFPIDHVLEWSLSKRETNTQAYVVPSQTSFVLMVRKEIGSW